MSEISALANHIRDLKQTLKHHGWNERNLEAQLSGIDHEATVMESKIHSLKCDITGLLKK